MHWSPSYAGSCNHCGESSAVSIQLARSFKWVALHSYQRYLCNPVQVVGSFIASFAAMLVEHFQLEESKGSVGKNVAAALFLISGFWAMIVFYIWQSAVQTDIEDELKQWYVMCARCLLLLPTHATHSVIICSLEYSFDNARIEMGDSQILVILGWLLCWVAAIAVMQVPKQRYNRRGSGKVAPSKGKIVTNDTLTQSSL